MAALSTERILLLVYFVLPRFTYAVEDGMPAGAGPRAGITSGVRHKPVQARLGLEALVRALVACRPPGDCEQPHAWML